MLSRLKRIFTGPSFSEMGIPTSTSGRTAPVHLDTPIPYKPGTEEALWPVVPKNPGRLRAWVNETLAGFKEAWSD